MNMPDLNGSNVLNGTEEEASLDVLKTVGAAFSRGCGRGAGERVSSGIGEEGLVGCSSSLSLASSLRSSLSDIDVKSFQNGTVNSLGVISSQGTT